MIKFSNLQRQKHFTLEHKRQQEKEKKKRNKITTIFMSSLHSFLEF